MAVEAHSKKAPDFYLQNYPVLQHGTFDTSHFQNINLLDASKPRIANYHTFASENGEFSSLNNQTWDMSAEVGQLHTRGINSKSQADHIRLQEQDVAIMNLKQQLEILTRKLASAENKYQSISDFFDQFEEESVRKEDTMKLEIKALNQRLVERENQYSRVQLEFETKGLNDMRLREDVTRLAASNSALEEKLADKNETIVRLNSRLRNLEKLGQALEQRGDELNQLDSEFHFEREQRLVLEKELKLLEKENQILHQKVDHLESEKSRQIELLNESKRGEVAYQM